MRISAFTFLLTSPIPLLPPIRHQLWQKALFYVLDDCYFYPTTEVFK